MAERDSEVPLLDTLQTASTPEGLRFVLHIAGVYPRALAFALDTLIQGGIVLVAALLIQLLLAEANWLLLLIVFLVQWFYSALFEGLNRGRTPGKLAAGLQVVQVDGAMIDFSAAVLRNLIRAADMFFFCFLIGLVAIGISPRFQRLGDLAAATVVIHVPRARRHRTQPPPDTTLVPEPPPAQLSTAEIQAILSFAQRYHQFSPARAHDLASLAIGGLYGEARHFDDPVRQLRAVAAWLAGNRPKADIS